MDIRIRFFVIALIPLLLFACHRRGTGDIHVAGDTYMPKPVVESPYKAKVVDVCNDSHQVFDVDVIGLLWNGMEDSLKKRGMLWAPNVGGGEPYTLEGHVLYFKKGSLAGRFFPYLGDTVLTVRVELSQGGTHIATIESRHKIAFGSRTMTYSAWKKIFAEVSEDVIDKAVTQFKEAP